MPQLAAGEIASIVAAAASVAGTIGSTIAASDKGAGNDKAIEAQRDNARRVSDYINSGPIGGMNDNTIGSNTTGRLGLGTNSVSGLTPGGLSGITTNTGSQNRPSRNSSAMGGF